MTVKCSKIDFNKIAKNGKVISTKESLRDIVPFSWKKEVLEGNAKVVVTEGGKENCAK